MCQSVRHMKTVYDIRRQVKWALGISLVTLLLVASLHF